MEAVLTNGVDCVALVTEILLSKLKKGWRIYLIRTYTYWHIKRLITTWIYIYAIYAKFRVDLFQSKLKEESNIQWSNHSFQSLIDLFLKNGLIGRE